MNDKEIKSAIESLLFVWGEPIKLKDLAKVLDVSVERIKSNIMHLKKELDEEIRGIQLIEVNDSYQLCTRRENYQYIEKLCMNSQSRGLSQPSLEVLAIIAYKQPITKHEIDNIRGVKSDKAINTLIERELVEVKGRLEKTGRPLIFGTTELFLKVFGFKSLEDLPEIENFENLDFLNNKE